MLINSFYDNLHMESINYYYNNTTAVIKNLKNTFVY